MILNDRRLQLNQKMKHKQLVLSLFLCIHTAQAQVISLLSNTNFCSLSASSMERITLSIIYFRSSCNPWDPKPSWIMFFNRLTKYSTKVNDIQFKDPFQVRQTWYLQY